MADMFASGAAWLNTTLRDHASRSVTLANKANNATTTVTAPAASGRTEWTEEEAEAVVHAYDTRDWLFDAADLRDVFGQPVRPARGWIITDSLDGQRYEVYAPPGLKPWRYCGTHNERVRVHSRALER